MPSLKEPSFFCANLPPHGVRTLDAYLALFAEAVNHRAIGEASPDYFTSPESAGLIRERYPHAKIIFVLRNPVDRAYSLYRLNCAVGVERMPSFERALAREDDRLRSDRFKRKNPYFWKACLYSRSGFTSEGIERFQQTFPREQIHIILLRDLKQRPVETIREVYAFLGVDPLFVPDFDVRNQSAYPLSVAANYVVCRVWRRYAAARRRRGWPLTGVDRCLEAAVRLNTWLGTRVRSNSVKPETRRHLSALYRKDIQKTASLIGRDLSDWLTAEAM